MFKRRERLLNELGSTLSEEAFVVVTDESLGPNVPVAVRSILVFGDIVSLVQEECYLTGWVSIRILSFMRFRLTEWQSPRRSIPKYDCSHE
jgi:hypothetical protein